ncbi:MAG: glycosyltransferase family 4 protein, partial [Chloroflexi bacterium]|nr:glycosyltransferase family 4 protein [Chloroflexota bacterium]
MRILQVVHWFLPRHTAGSEVYTYQLARELAQRHEVALYCREEGRPERELAAEDDAYAGLPVHR